MTVNLTKSRGKLLFFSGATWQYSVIFDGAEKDIQMTEKSDRRKHINISFAFLIKNAYKLLFEKVVSSLKSHLHYSEVSNASPNASYTKRFWQIPTSEGAILPSPCKSDILVKCGF